LAGKEEKKRKKKGAGLGCAVAVWVIPTKDTLKGEEVTQSESSEIESFTQKSAAFRVPPFWTLEVSFYKYSLLSFLFFFFSAGIIFLIFPFLF